MTTRTPTKPADSECATDSRSVPDATRSPFLEFAVAVSDMREAQRHYQQLRKKKATPEVCYAALCECWRIEKVVDLWLADIKRGEVQASLF